MTSSWHLLIPLDAVEAGSLLQPIPTVDPHSTLHDVDPFLTARVPRTNEASDLTLLRNDVELGSVRSVLDVLAQVAIDLGHEGCAWPGPSNSAVLATFLERGALNVGATVFGRIYSDEIVEGSFGFESSCREAGVGRRDRGSEAGSGEGDDEEVGEMHRDLVW